MVKKNEKSRQTLEESKAKLRKLANESVSAKESEDSAENGINGHNNNHKAF
jgi:hypothetical protein